MLLWFNYWLFYFEFQYWQSTCTFVVIYQRRIIVYYVYVDLVGFFSFIYSKVYLVFS